MLRTVGGGGRSASLEPDLRRTRARRADEQQDGGRLGFSRSAESKVQKAPAPPPFIGRARLFGKPAIQQGAALRETRNPTVRRQSTVTSKTPAEPLRARAASPPSSDVFGTRRLCRTGPSEGKCWGEGKDATLRSRPSLITAGQTETEQAGTPFAPFGTRRRPATKSSRCAASFSSEAHV